MVVFDLHERSEEGRLDVSGARLDHGCALETLGQPLHSPVDLPELSLAVNVLGVLASVPLGGRIGDLLNNLRPLPVAQVRELPLKPFRSLASDVVAAGF